MPVLRTLGKPQKNYKKTDSYYKEEDSIERLIRYITRTRVNEDRANELISVGGCGVSFDYGIEYIIEQIKQTQRFYEIDNRGGRRLYHEEYSFSDNEVYSLGIKLIDQIGYEISRYYFCLGYETLYAVHYSENKHFHIHIVHNSSNYITGKKYHENWHDNWIKEQAFNDIVCEVYRREYDRRICNMNPVIPIMFNDFLNKETLKKRKYSIENEGKYGTYDYIAV